jgi:hypothetical protein
MSRKTKSQKKQIDLKDKKVRKLETVADNDLKGVAGGSLNGGGGGGGDTPPHAC